MLRAASLFLLALAACATPPTRPEAASPAPDALTQLKAEAQALAPIVTTPLGKRFLAATAQVTRPHPPPLFTDAKQEKVLTASLRAALPEAERAALEPLSSQDAEEFFLNTRYGSPLAYARAMDVLGAAAVDAKPGARWLDFGFGHVSQLYLFANLGLHVTGVDVSPMLAELYAAPDAQGAYGSGQVKLVIGRYPADQATLAAVGGGYDVIISKNTLKRGYIHPYRPAKPEWTIQLGVSDEEFLKTLHDALKPGGKLLMYNICPALTPEDKPFVPWSDGRSAFSREQYEAAGFEVKAFDVDDLAYVQDMAHRLGWDKPPDGMDLVHDLSVLYTLVERRP